MDHRGSVANPTPIPWAIILVFCAAPLPRAECGDPYQLEILPVLVSNDDGSQGPPLDGPLDSSTGMRVPWADYFENMVVFANTVYEPQGVVFHFDRTSFHPTLLRSTLINRNVTLDPAVEANLAAYRNENVKPPHNWYPNSIERNSFAANHPDKIVLFYTYAFDLRWDDSKGHWTLSTTANWSNWTDNFVVLYPLTGARDLFIFAHEVGHYLHLQHTFGPQPMTEKAARDTIKWYVDSMDHHPDDGLLVFDGDFGWVMDTPPDPGPGLWQAVFGSSCSAQTTLTLMVALDGGTRPYHLGPDRENIMSYHFPRAWPDATCIAAGYYPRLSPEQGARVRAAVTTGNRRDLTSEISVQWQNPPPTVVSWGPDRLDILSSGVDRGVYHKYWGSSGWSPADVVESFHPLFGRVSDSPTAVSWGPGRLDVFARGEDGAIWHKAWAGDALPDGQCYDESFQSRCWWPHTIQWHSLGGLVSGSPAAVSWGPGRFDLFARGNSGGVWHKGWDDAFGWFPSVDGWSYLGGEIVGAPAAVSWGYGRFDIFARAVGGDVIHKAYDQSSDWAPTGTAWDSLGGFVTGTPAAISWGPGRFDLFARGSDGRVWHKGWDDAFGWFPSPLDWVPLGGNITDDPAAVSWGPGRFDIFARSVDGDVIHKAYDQSFGWAPAGMDWESLGGLTSGRPTAASWGPDRLDIFTRGEHGGIWHKAWSAGWYPSQEDWEYLGYYPTAELVFPEGPGVCPSQGDTHATGLSASGPGGNAPGRYLASATARDDSGDPILYTFTLYRSVVAVQVVGPQTSSTASFDLAPGTWRITVSVDDEPYCPDKATDATRTVSVVVVDAGAPRFRRADANADGQTDISDAISILGWLFLGNQAPDCKAALNVNGDLKVDISDGVALLSHLFLGGPAPVAPYPGCATSSIPADADIGCEAPPASCQ